MNSDEGVSKDVIDNSGDMHFTVKSKKGAQRYSHYRVPSLVDFTPPSGEVMCGEVSSLSAIQTSSISFSYSFTPRLICNSSFSQ
jgi:hypothetical protein